MYDLPSSKASRAPSFGFGSRFDFSKQSKNTPPPNSYTLPSTVEKKSPFSFGISREQAKRSIEGHFQADPTIPGPGTYPYRARVGEGLKFSFGDKTPYELRMDNSPGPGAYDPNFERNKGNYLLSTCKSPRFMTCLLYTSPSPRDS